MSRTNEQSVKEWVIIGLYSGIIYYTISENRYYLTGIDILERRLRQTVKDVGAENNL